MILDECQPCRVVVMTAIVSPKRVQIPAAALRFYSRLVTVIGVSRNKSNACDKSDVI